MKPFRSPLVVAILGGVLGLGAGLGWFWLQAQSVVTEVRAARLAAAEPARPAKPWDFWTLEIDNLASELKDAKALLAKREEELALRENRLAAEVREMEKLRAQLEALRTEIGQRVVEVQAEELRNLKSLAATYSNLTPKAALAIMREMDDGMIAKLLALMKPDVTGPIFEEMAQASGSDPALAKRAAELSDRLRLLRPVKAAQAP